MEIRAHYKDLMGDATNNLCTEGGDTKNGMHRGYDPNFITHFTVFYDLCPNSTDETKEDAINLLERIKLGLAQSNSRLEECGRI